MQQTKPRHWLVRLSGNLLNPARTAARNRLLVVGKRCEYGWEQSCMTPIDPMAR